MKKLYVFEEDEHEKIGQLLTDAMHMLNCSEHTDKFIEAAICNIERANVILDGYDS